MSSSRNRQDNYATFGDGSGYSLDRKTKKENSMNPPSYTAQQPQQQKNSESEMFNTSYTLNQPSIPASTDEVDDGSISLIDNDKLYELLTNPKFQKTPQGTSAKIFIKCETQWCKPCKKAAPFFCSLSHNPNFKNILFIRFDVDNIKPNLRAILNEINVVPCFFYFNGGQKLDMTVGADKTEILDKLTNLSKLN